MTWSQRIRASHRWISIVFTLTVVANFVALGLSGGRQPAPWITYAPLLPIALLLFSGLYLFALPYVVRNAHSAKSAGADPRGS